MRLRVTTAGNSMRASLNFSLPEDDSEFNAALLGRKALSVLWSIDCRLRDLSKYGDSPEGAQRVAREIRAMIPAEMLEA